MTDKANKVNLMELWDKVSKTNPDHTKAVSFGRKFTAIDAHSQVMEATRAFGPAGSGWGYENVYGEIHLTDGRIIAWCDVTFWWRSTDEWEGNKVHGTQHSFGPIRGSAMLTTFEKGTTNIKQPDTDAYKKASTDGLTKLLSHLGFNADVFLGEFDDNKYVDSLKQESADTRKKFAEAIRTTHSEKQIEAVMKKYSKWLGGLKAATLVDIKVFVNEHKLQFDESANTTDGDNNGSK